MFAIEVSSVGEDRAAVQRQRIQYKISRVIKLITQSQFPNVIEQNPELPLKQAVLIE